MKKLILKLSLALLLVFLGAFLASEFLTPQWVDSNNPQTLQMDDFEKLEENSLDVLVLGSCQSYQGFNPAVLWEDHGLRSYVLAGPDQRLYMTYHYLNYALQTQSPKVVLLDALMLILPNTESKAYDTKSIFSIKDRDFRMSAAEEVFELHYSKDRSLPQYSFDKFLNRVKTTFPIFTFNSALDLSPATLKYFLGTLESTAYNGGVPVYTLMDATVAGDYMSENNKEDSTLDPLAKKYTDKILELCQQNGIQLILYKTVSPSFWSHDRHETVAEYAHDRDLVFLDFNTDPSAYGIDLAKHMYAPWKLNADGMAVTTSYLGAYLKENYGELLSAESSEETTAYYDAMLARYHKAYNSAIWTTATYPTD